jgi:hypothetical protein
MTTATPDLYVFRGRRYLFRAVDIIEYRENMRIRSPSWDTVTLPLTVYRSLVRPLREFILPRPSEGVPF